MKTDLNLTTGSPETSSEGAISPADFNTRRSGSDRRVEPRIERHKQIMIFPYRPPAGSAFERVDMFDCSPHGIGVLADQPIPVGDLFLAKLKLEKITLVAYEVRHCVPTNGRYKVGAWLTGLVGRSDLCEPNTVLNALLHGEA